MTSIPDELDLVGAGLEYIPMEPFATGFFRDGRIVRFHRDNEQTVASIAERDRADAEAYRAFMHKAVPLVKTAVTGLESGSSAKGVGKAVTRKLWQLLQGLARNGDPIGLAHDLVTPYGALLETALRTDLTRGPVSAFASHSSAGPHQPGGAFFVYGRPHTTCSGSGTPAAAARHSSMRSNAGSSKGGRDPHERRGGAHRRRRGRARAVVLQDGERIEASAVITAVDVQAALLDLLDPPLSGPPAHELAAAHRGNTVHLLDLRTWPERRLMGVPPDCQPVHLLRHLLKPAGPDTVYL